MFVSRVETRANLFESKTRNPFIQVIPWKPCDDFMTKALVVTRNTFAREFLFFVRISGNYGDITAKSAVVRRFERYTTFYSGGK